MRARPTGDASLARSTGYAAEFAEQAGRAERPSARASATVPAVALRDLAPFLDQRFPYTGCARQQIFRAYAGDHGSG